MGACISDGIQVVLEKVFKNELLIELCNDCQNHVRVLLGREYSIGTTR